MLVWQKAIHAAKDIYTATGDFPKSEMYGLASQIRRSSVSIPSNIAEGYGRRSAGDYHRFLTVAMGSLFELETQLLIAREVSYLDAGVHDKLAGMIDEIEAMLEALIRKIKP